MDVQNVKYVLSETYFCPNSIKIKVLKVTKKEKSPNLNLAEPSEEKSLLFSFTSC